MLGETTQLVQPVSRFQRAIHVRYDLRDSEIIAQYVPTETTSQTINTILNGTKEEATQRSHLLYAAYGSGKSHLAVALAALLENNTQSDEALQQFVRRLQFTNGEAGESIQNYKEQDRHLLPIVLTGNEGDFATSILRALIRSLKDAGLEDIRLQTRFEAALATLDRWKIEYPEVAERFEKVLQTNTKRKLKSFEEALRKHDDSSYSQFVDIYSSLTAGARFDPFTEQSPQVVYRDVVTAVKDHGYDGIVVIWDEFGRYLEGNAAQAFGSEAAMLQDFAETCNHSADDKQLHLILITHKEIQGYASGLPQEYQVEWSRIEGRFQKHNITTDPSVAYKLIAAAIHQTTENQIYDFIDRETVDWYVDWAHDINLFGMLPRDEIRELIQQTFPLHPLSVFALAHVSSRVAQNERTMFTFLTSDEPNSLINVVNTKMQNNGNTPIIYASDLWDYFEESIRADIGGAGAHKHWSGVVHALDKVAPDDEMGQQIVKGLGILTICADSSSLRPTSEIISWAIGARDDEQHADIVTTLDYLRRRKAIINRQIDGYWTFIAGSDINFEDELNKALERTNPTPVQLRRLLEQYVPVPSTLARRYNQEYSMTRYFTGLYRWVDEIEDAPWDLQISELKTDGIVIYVLATSDVEWDKAFEYIQDNERVVYVLPRKGQQKLFALDDTLRELFALQEVAADPKLHQHEDRKRVDKEINWLLEDAKGRLENLVANLIDPRRDSSLWIKVEDHKAYGYDINSPGQATKIISDICQKIFPLTPELNSEGLNRNEPTTQQSRAAETVINAMFARQPSETFGIDGRGPDVLALNSIVKNTGILRPVDKIGNEIVWGFGRPTNERLAQIWDIISDYLDSASKQTPLAPLISNLTSPPFGLREGIIPLILASVLRERLKVTTVWKGRNPIGAVTGETIYEIIETSEDYSIKIGDWNAQHEYIWNALIDLFDTYILETERDSQPLAMIKTAMLRWLQALPSYCRDTKQVSVKADEFRAVIRQSVREPAQALFETLPEVLSISEDTPQEDINQSIATLMQEISNAYLDLQRRLDEFVQQSFGMEGLSGNAAITLKSWLASVRVGEDTDIEEFRFGSMITQNFVDVVLNIEEDDSQFWNKLSEALLGVTLRDWNDESEKRFRDRILDAREEVERDVQDLIEEDKAISFSIEMPDTGKQDFRFRASDLSSQGQRILQNFKSTMQVAGRPLSVDEKRKVALAFVIHIMGDDID